MFLSLCRLMSWQYLCCRLLWRLLQCGQFICPVQLQHCTHCTHQPTLFSQSSSRLVLLWHWVILSTSQQLHPYRIGYYVPSWSLWYGLPQLLKAVPQFSLGGAGAGAGLSGIMACIFCYRLLVSEAQGAAGHNLDNGGSGGTVGHCGNITLGNRYDILQDFV